MRKHKRAYYKKNSEHILALNASYPKDVKGNRAAGLRWRIRNPEMRIWSTARSRAKMRGIEFSITIEEIVIPERCPVFGTALVTGHGRGRGIRDESPSLDRVNNSKGYVSGNVAVISGRANKIKNEGSAEDHRKIADWIDHFSGKGLEAK